MVRRKEEEKILDVNATMQGSLVFSDPVNLRINGKFEGTLSTKGNLIIGKNAEVKADIIGESITVAGAITGKIKATTSLQLTASAYVYGDITVAKLSVEEGAIFNGCCKILEDKISLEELSNYLAIEEQKIMEWANGGKIPVEKEGDRLMFDRREVENWIAHKV